MVVIVTKSQKYVSNCISLESEIERPYLIQPEIAVSSRDNYRRAKKP